GIAVPVNRVRIEKILTSSLTLEPAYLLYPLATRICTIGWFRPCPSPAVIADSLLQVAFGRLLPLLFLLPGPADIFWAAAFPRSAVTLFGSGSPPGARGHAYPVPVPCAAAPLPVRLHMD